MLEVSAGISAITIAADALSGQWRDPLTSMRVPTGAQVKVSFQRRLQLPPHQPVRIRYDLAGNGSVREAHGVPRHEDTIMVGADVFYLYSLTYWVPPHAVMKFLAAPAHEMPLAMTA
jgi:hypothetical protein